MTPSDLLRRPPLGESISINRHGDVVTGVLIGFSVRPEKLNITKFGQAGSSYLPGPTTITVVLAPWWADIDLSPEDEIQVVQRVDG